MSMPQIPEGTNRPSAKETVIDLLESIALEEIAISHILNAQGEKIQEIIKKFSTEDISYCQLLDGCKISQEMINSLIMKEWLLTTKLSNVSKLNIIDGTHNLNCNISNCNKSSECAEHQKKSHCNNICNNPHCDRCNYYNDFENKNTNCRPKC